MLPPSPHSTYKQYKDDTTYFASRLAKTAQACGSKSNVFTAADDALLKILKPKTKPKVKKGKSAKKAARDAARRLPESQLQQLRQKHTIPLMEFLALTHDILTFDPPVQVPHRDS